MTQTTREYSSLDNAFQFMNRELFEDELPELLITFQRKANTKGYYHKDKFASREGEGQISELALNPDNFEGRSDIEILSTLVHEMVHHWQNHFGRAGKGKYHNKEFANKMFEIGLQPTSDGTPQGKTTGPKVTHLIIENGPFDLAAKKFLEEYQFKISWQSINEVKQKKKADPSKVKFQCNCPHAVWGKIFSIIVCPNCMSVFKWADRQKVFNYIAEHQLEKELEEYIEKISNIESELNKGENNDNS
ncbi:MAG: SprT-like domain-containing protein [Bacteroidales bacterium]